MKCGELARRAGCHLETIRHYVKISLLPEPARTANSYRIYDDAQVDRLRFILRGRELGFSIEEMRSLLDLLDRGNQTCAEVKARTEHYPVDVRTKIADLKPIETILARTAVQCSGDAAPECPIFEALTS